MRRIVVGTDFSPASGPALTQALALAHHTDRDLVLVHVAPPGDSHQARCQLQQMCLELGNQPVTVHHAIVTGAPDVGLTIAAQTLAADLIAVGSHDRTELPRLLGRSVAENIACMAEQDLLVARGTVTAAGGYHRVLVPTDFSPDAEQALRAALRLVATDGEVELLHCWTPADWAADTKRHRTRQREGARAVGAQLLREYRGCHSKLTFTEQETPAESGIRRHLTQGNFGLVVMGSRGRRQTQGWILGSVVSHLLRRTRCSILVVHHDRDLRAAAVAHPAIGI